MPARLDRSRQAPNPPVLAGGQDRGFQALEQRALEGPAGQLAAGQERSSSTSGWVAREESTAVSSGSGLGGRKENGVTGGDAATYGRTRPPSCTTAACTPPHHQRAAPAPHLCTTASASRVCSPGAAASAASRILMPLPPLPWSPSVSSSRARYGKATHTHARSSAAHGCRGTSYRKLVQFASSCATGTAARHNAANGLAAAPALSHNRPRAAAQPSAPCCCSGRRSAAPRPGSPQRAQRGCMGPQQAQQSASCKFATDAAERPRTAATAA